MRAGRIFFMALAAFLTLLAAGSQALATMVSLTFDDGLAGAYNSAYPVLKKYGAPGVSGIITGRIDPANDDYMSWEQIRELSAAGWEIVSHSVNHARPIQVPVFYSQEPIHGWTRDSPDAPIYQAHYDYELITGLFENGKPLKEVETIKELNYKPGSFFFDRVIEELHIRPFNPPEDPSSLDIRAFSYEREMEQSKKDLIEHGIEAKTFVAPYNYWTDDVREASKRYYQYAVIGKGEDNRPGSYDPYGIKRFMVHKDDTVASLMRIVTQNAVDKNSWVIFCLHGIGDNTGWEPWSADKLDKFVAWLRQENIDIVTVAEGARRMAECAASKARAGTAPACKAAPGKSAQGKPAKAKAAPGK
ncbi:MAG: polysaccharide deacetylase family protein [Desulfovibrionaceae bacterium]|nr:polysaccharide deacetylase family protein [Desulfovibrionaceae bacterium]MBF0514976.1 polysaccharide deacetylase family protein [Desulfovibrionaceae bacterium]